MTTRRWDVVVVGARVAGAATGMLLARSGLRVLVLDRMRPGADTLSTHALMRAGTLQLRRWGLLEALVDAGTPAVTRTVFHYADGESVPVSIKPAAGVDALYAPRRTLLDRLLAEEAARCGATVEHGVTVTALLRGDHGRVTGVRVRDADGRVREEHAEIVIGADGRSSLVAAQVGAATLVQGRSASSIVYGYFDGLPSEGYEWVWAPRRAAGVIPTSGGLSCAFVAAPPQEMAGVRAVLGPDAAFRALVGEAAPALLERLDAATPVGRLRHDRGVPGHLRAASGPGWALVGDAGYWKDPLSTHGMTDALRDADLLARAVVDAVPAGSWSTPTGRAALGRYQATRDRLSVRMVDVAERMAAFTWDLAGIRGLLRELASAMSDEVEALSELPPAA
ncbi:MAG TPA: NAD(P)/FAD-dependent oxidoreductase [Phycicoccus sp.]